MRGRFLGRRFSRFLKLEFSIRPTNFHFGLLHFGARWSLDF